MSRKMMSIVLTLCLMITAVPFGAVSASAASSGSESVFVKQDGSGKCTLASAVMLIRQTAIQNGEQNWSYITQSRLTSTAWLTGVGLLHSFSWHGIKVSYKNLTVEDKWDELIRLLDVHPEGIIVYLRSIPHAVLLTRYSQSEEKFYCADPAISTSELSIESSWLRTLKSGATQEEIVNAVDCYWYVSSCSYTPITAAELGGSDDSANNGSEDVIVSPSETKMQIEVVKLSQVNSYQSGLFKDIDSSDWYYSYAKSAYELGLMNGSDGKFDADGNITIAQTITIASRMHSLYYKNGYDFSVSAGEEWYQPYVDYASDNGIISDKYKNANMNANAARLEFAEILSKSLPDKALAEINEAPSGTFPDVSSVSDAGKAVYQLYKAGILTGSTDGKFHPVDSISRAEAAAVITRMADSSQRVKI